MMPVPRVYRLLENESLWEAASRCHQLFNASKIAHAICGGVAVCLHGYHRNTTDVDWIIRPEDFQQVKQLLVADGFTWDDEQREFRSPSGVQIPFLIAGEKAGRDSEVLIPDPVGDSNVEVCEGVIVVRLSRLIEMKLACGLSNLRRTHKDFADVVELIAIRKLNGAFTRYLHPSLRSTFRQLLKNASAD